MQDGRSLLWRQPLVFKDPFWGRETDSLVSAVLTSQFTLDWRSFLVFLQPLLLVPGGQLIECRL